MFFHRYQFIFVSQLIKLSAVLQSHSQNNLVTEIVDVVFNNGNQLYADPPSMC